MSKVILIDLDDTLENLCSAWCKSLNDRYGTDVTVDEITDWDILKFFPALNEEQAYEPFHDDNFWKTVEPKPDAVEYVKKLFDEGYGIYICTSTFYKSIRAKYEYIIRRYFPYIKWDHVIVTSNKQMIKADYLIDDGFHNLIGGDYAKILMSAPHNRKYNAEENGMTRVENWKEAYGYIHGGECDKNQFVTR